MTIEITHTPTINLTPRITKIRIYTNAYKADTSNQKATDVNEPLVTIGCLQVQLLNKLGETVGWIEAPEMGINGTEIGHKKIQVLGLQIEDDEIKAALSHEVVWVMADNITMYPNGQPAPPLIEDKW